MEVTALSEAYSKLTQLLRQLFQFDRADLDFGVYRVMNQRRAEISSFLENDLLPQVEEAFRQHRSEDASRVREEIERLTRTLEDAGVPLESSAKYVELRKQLESDADISALENEVYSDLYTFFSRYYKDGDFISQRRYKPGVYAIPYEGEEVKLHWANADQYYVKTTEDFQDYRFAVSEDPDNQEAEKRIVHFRLVMATTERDNNQEQQGKERRFVLRDENPVEELDGELVVYFEYRQHPDKQAFLNKQTCETVFAELETPDLDDFWTNVLSVKHPTEKDKERTFLKRQLFKYTDKNKFDYFVHKNLRGFLNRELDFFLKNEVLRLDDLDTDQEQRVESYLSKLRVIKRVGLKIIAFLAQLEDFQKKLFEKKKFVVRADYCLTLDNVPDALYPEIIANDKQYEEWGQLFKISELDDANDQHNEKWLEDHPCLVLDTALFEQDFKDRLLSSFDNLDQQTDGLLISSENLQALNLLHARYREQVKCVYIDPPFNTGDDGFLYKDNYQHSSWLTLIRSNLEKLKHLSQASGSLFVHIDDNELGYLLPLMDTIFDRGNKVAVATFKQSSVSGPKAMNPGLANISSFVLWYAKDKAEWNPNRVYVPTQRDKRYNNFIVNRREHHSQWQIDTLRNAFAAKVGIPAKQLQARFGNSLERELDNFVLEAPEDVVQLVRVTPKDVNAEARKQLLKSQKDAETTYAAPRQDREDYYFLNGKQLAFYSAKVRQVNGQHVTAEPASTIWTDLLSNNVHVEGGVAFENGKKPVALLKRIAELSMKARDIVLDCFAGSGTTGHAIIDLNREDGGTRKYILVEMGEYFDSVLKPRIQKVIYSKDWRAGKPVSREGSSHVFKYMKLESYEDTLNNLSLTPSEQQQKLTAANASLREDYMISYMLEAETEGSPSLVNQDGFARPFSYQLMISEGGEIRPTDVDLVETFNYLLGLSVERVQSEDNFKTVEGTLPSGERTLVIWREIEGIAEASEAALEEFFERHGYGSRTGEGAILRIYVNGDNALGRLRKPEDRWQVYLIEEEFKRLMFGGDATVSGTVESV